MTFSRQSSSKSNSSLRMKIKTWIRFLRPRALLWFGISTSLGFGAMVLQELPSWDYLVFIGLILLTNAASIIVNDIGDKEADAKSDEESRFRRPLVTGEISIRTAAIVAALLYGGAIVISIVHSQAAFIYVLVVIFFGISYSLPPLRFDARPFGSFFYWIFLVIFCYFLLLGYFEKITFPILFDLLKCNLSALSELGYQGNLFKSLPGYVFFAGVLIYMGVAEILAKDLRDFENDKAGGKHTFVGMIGWKNAATLVIPTAWAGMVLWVYSLYLSGLFVKSPFPWICSFVCLFWYSKIVKFCAIIIKGYHQKTAASLHSQWTVYYLIMQACTFCSFIEW